MLVPAEKLPKETAEDIQRLMLWSGNGEIGQQCHGNVAWITWNMEG